MWFFVGLDQALVIVFLALFYALLDPSSKNHPTIKAIIENQIKHFGDAQYFL